MKKILIMVLCCCFAGCNGLKNFPKENGVILKNSKAGLVSTGLTNVDTLKSDLYDTIPDPNGYKLGYSKDPAMIDFLKPYMLSNICEPGNYNHPIYMQFMEKGRSMASSVMQKLILRLQQRANSRKEIEERIANINELYNCNLVQMPVYYLTPNIVQYNDGENLKKYYTLDTSAFTYQIFKDNALIGILHYSKGVSDIWHNYITYIKCYNKVVSLKKHPIAIKQDIQIPGINFSGFYSNFAYVNSHLVLITYNQGEIVKTDSTNNQFIRPYEEFKTVIAELAFSNGGVNSLIKQRLQQVKAGIEQWNKIKK